MPKMLIAESETALLQAFQQWFERQKFSVDTAATGKEALAMLLSGCFDVALIDVMLPGLDGLSVCAHYRQSLGSTTVLLLLTDQWEEIPAAEIAGADAYVCRSAELAEFSARVASLLRTVGSRNLLKCKNISLDASSGIVRKDGMVLLLHPMELNLLEFFLKHPNQTYSAQALWERVWKDKSESLIDTVRTHIKTLRQKIDTVNHPSVIVTVRGRGYRIDTV